MRSSSPTTDSASSSSTEPGTPPDAEVDMVNVDEKQPAAWNEPYTFHTLAMQKRFMHPSTKGRDVPELREVSRPHIESFNALWAENPSIDATTKVGLEGMGLLERSLQTLSSRVVFDGHGDQDKGNRLECEYVCLT